MATARMLADRPLQTPTVRQFQKATLLALAAVALGGIVYLIETFVLQSRHRFVENPADVMMRGFGIAHFCVGWLFLFTSPRLRNGPALAQLAFWTLAGMALCLISFYNGGAKHPLLLMAFYAYFLVHEIRDEAALFQAYGDAPADEERDGFLRHIARSVTVSLMTMLATTYALHGRIVEKLETLLLHPAQWVAVLVAALWLASGLSWLMTQRFVRRHQLNWADYRPLLAVYAGIATLLGVGSLFGSFGFNLIVLIHVAAWFIFTYERLARQPCSGRRGWTWLRGTATGFLTLHAAAALIVLMLMALRVHLWERVGWISVLFATSSFHYWSIMHITMAFWRPR